MHNQYRAFTTRHQVYERAPARSFIHRFLLSQKLMPGDRRLEEQFGFLSGLPIGQLRFSQCTITNAAPAILPQFKNKTKSIKFMQISTKPKDINMADTHQKVLISALEQSKLSESESRTLNVEDILILRQLIQKHKFLGMLAPLGLSTSFDYGFILTHQPVTHEFAVQAKTEPITLQLYS